MTVKKRDIKVGGKVNDVGYCLYRVSGKNVLYTFLNQLIYSDWGQVPSPPSFM